MVEGEPVELGELSFNVTFSRFLNPNDNEDSAYLVGQRNRRRRLHLLRRLLRSPERKRRAAALPDSLKITDADHDRASTRCPAKASTRCQLGGEVEEQEQIPVLDSTAQLGPIEGSVAIFLLPEGHRERGR